MPVMPLVRGKPYNCASDLLWCRGWAWKLQNTALCQLLYLDTPFVEPEVYFRAALEMLLLLLIIPMAVTTMYNPEIYVMNRLKERFGYNNFCVGFDEPPASVVAVPLISLTAYFQFRYATTNLLRSSMLGSAQPHWLVRFSSAYLATAGMCLPGLLVVPPSMSFWVHYGIFLVELSSVGLSVGTTFFVTAAEQDATKQRQHLYGWVFVIDTFLFLASSLVTAVAHELRLANRGPGDLPERLGEGQAAVPAPIIPASWLQFFDVLWFGLLPLLPFALPNAQLIEVEYRLAEMDPAPRRPGANGAWQARTDLGLSPEELQRRTDLIPCPVLAAAFHNGDLTPDENGCVTVNQIEHVLRVTGMWSRFLIHQMKQRVVIMGNRVNLFDFTNTVHLHSTYSGIRRAAPSENGPVVRRRRVGTGAEAAPHYAPGADVEEPAAGEAGQAARFRPDVDRFTQLAKHAKGGRLYKADIRAGARSFFREQGLRAHHDPTNPIPMADLEKAYLMLLMVFGQLDEERPDGDRYLTVEALHELVLQGHWPRAWRRHHYDLFEHLSYTRF